MYQDLTVHLGKHSDRDLLPIGSSSFLKLFGKDKFYEFPPYILCLLSKPGVSGSANNEDFFSC